jgi:hypothetical protein
VAVLLEVHAGEFCNTHFARHQEAVCTCLHATSVSCLLTIVCSM